jgi:hypothetical protein
LTMVLSIEIPSSGITWPVSVAPEIIAMWATVATNIRNLILSLLNKGLKMDHGFTSGSIKPSLGIPSSFCSRHTILQERKKK